MTAIHAMLEHAQSPEALKLRADCVEAQRARRIQEEADLDAGESTE